MEPHISAKEPYISANEPYISTKEPTYPQKSPVYASTSGGDPNGKWGNESWHTCEWVVSHPWRGRSSRTRTSWKISVIQLKTEDRHKIRKKIKRTKESRYETLTKKWKSVRNKGKKMKIGTTRKCKGKYVFIITVYLCIYRWQEGRGKEGASCSFFHRAPSFFHIVLLLSFDLGQLPSSITFIN